MTRALHQAGAKLLDAKDLIVEASTDSCGMWNRGPVEPKVMRELLEDIGILWERVSAAMLISLKSDIQECQKIMQEEGRS